VERCDFKRISVDFYDACPSWWTAAEASVLTQGHDTTEVFLSLVNHGQAITTKAHAEEFALWAASLPGWNDAEGNHPILIEE